MNHKNLTENSTLVSSAYAQLKGNWSTPVGAFLVINILQNMGGAIPYIGGIMMAFTLGAIQLGMAKFSLLIVRNEKHELEDIFSGFKDWLKSAGLFWRTMLFVVLWSFLLIIPGIVAMYSYSMTFFVKADNPDLTAKEIMDKSKALMDGAKWKLFRINLRIFLLGILCIFTLFIGLLWVIPYSYTLKAKFYQDLTKDSSNSIQQTLIDDFGKTEEFEDYSEQ